MLVTCDFCHIKMMPESEKVHSLHAANGHDATCCEWCFRLLNHEQFQPAATEPTNSEHAVDPSYGVSAYDRGLLESFNIRW